jgi:hypothetical protein
MNEDFEQELRDALRRKDPSAGFEDRVLAAAAGSRVIRPVPIGRSNPWRWITPIAAALVMTAGIAWQREHASEEQAKGQAAKAKLELALKITSAKLHHIQEKLEESE